jgi:hypothetical protein
MKKLAGVMVLLLVASTAAFGQVVVNEWQIPSSTP